MAAVASRFSFTGAHGADDDRASLLTRWNVYSGLEVLRSMSPTIHRDGNRRFFFFSREEPRMHVHIASPDGEAKFWLEPTVELANGVGFGAKQLKDLQKIVEGHADEFKCRWEEYFGT